ncbi:MAG: competence/damage-inducible protein A [Flavobacteriaceae bacterium]|tara:strand:- start:491 stop:1732 length:1242 start_codon:yes stop_codon:yes gene_type:complete
MISEIISIGDEILIGQIVNTNSVFIAKELNKIGIEVGQITAISDNSKKIINSLNLAKERADIVIITGGLGPTKDDLTKHTLCKYFNDVLIENKDVLDHIEEIFLKYVSTPINEKNRAQALLPSKAKIFKNNYGTACGMCFKKENVYFISLPGVPFEMKEIFEIEILPFLKSEFSRQIIVHKTILTYGLGESAIAERIESWENSLPKSIKLAYLPNLGRVRLRLSSKGSNEKQINKKINDSINELYPLLEDIIVGIEGETSIEKRIFELFKSHSKTLSLAESCTGGKIASRIVNLSGASQYFKGGLIPYNNNAKESLLNIPRVVIDKFSDVSEEVAMRMAIEVRKKFNSDISLAVTGNAGPLKGNNNEPIGKVFIAVSSKNKSFVKEFNFGNHRERIIERAVNKSFEILLKVFT